MKQDFCRHYSSSHSLPNSVPKGPGGTRPEGVESGCWPGTGMPAAAIPSGWEAQELAEMFAAAILEAIDSATKPLGETCLSQGLKSNFLNSNQPGRHSSSSRR